MLKLLFISLLISYPFCNLEIFEDTDTVIPCPTCQEIDLTEFKQSQRQNSLLVENLTQPEIDTNVVALRFEKYKNWFPLGSKKQTLCGKASHFNTHKLARENDHNLRIIPHLSIEYLMTKALHRKPKNKDWHSCEDGKDNCMEAEITPPAEFVENDGHTYFEELLNCHTCVYGAWVTERIHNHRPEIHPTETLWFKDKNSWKIFLFQDESRRFDKKNRFKLIDKKKGKKKDILPWVLDTLSVDVKFFFTLEEKETTKEFKFKVLEAPQHIKDNWKDKTHLVKLYNKNSEIEVEQIGENPLINISDVKVCEDNGVKKGYIQFQTQTYRKHTKRGYLILEIEDVK